MGNLVGQTLGQVDDPDSVEGAALNAHTTTNAECFRDKADCARSFNVNTDFSSLVEWAGFLALLVAFLGLALVGVDDGDTDLLVAAFTFLVGHLFL